MVFISASLMCEESWHHILQKAIVPKLTGYALVCSSNGTLCISILYLVLPLGCLKTKIVHFFCHFAIEIIFNVCRGCQKRVQPVRKFADGKLAKC